MMKDFSKLPIRQVTAFIADNVIFTLSKLPIRQVTTLLVAA